MRWNFVLRPAAVCVLLVSLGCAATAPLPAAALELSRSGAEALAAGDLEVADARLSLALEYSPSFVEALVNLALVETERGNFARARKLLRRAARLNPDVAQPHHGLGLLAERERRPDRAAESYREALRVDPGFAPARANLGRLLFDAGQLEAARITFQKLAEVAPDEPDGPIGLAETLLRLGRRAQAEAITQAALARFPEHPGLRLLIARERLRGGRPGDAVTVLLSLASRRDEYGAAALAWLATAELARGRPRHAVGAARKALALEPDHPVAVATLTRALALIGASGAPPASGAQN